MGIRPHFVHKGFLLFRTTNTTNLLNVTTGIGFNRTDKEAIKVTPKVMEEVEGLVRISTSFVEGGMNQASVGQKTSGFVGIVGVIILLKIADNLIR